MTGHKRLPACVIAHCLLACISGCAALPDGGQSDPALDVASVVPVAVRETARNSSGHSYRFGADEDNVVWSDQTFAADPQGLIGKIVVRKADGSSRLASGRVSVDAVSSRMAPTIVNQRIIEKRDVVDLSALGAFAVRLDDESKYSVTVTNIGSWRAVESEKYEVDTISFLSKADLPQNDDIKSILRIDGVTHKLVAYKRFYRSGSGSSAGLWSLSWNNEIYQQSDEFELVSIFELSVSEPLGRFRRPK